MKIPQVSQVQPVHNQICHTPPHNEGFPKPLGQSYPKVRGHIF